MCVSNCVASRLCCSWLLQVSRHISPAVRIQPQSVGTCGAVSLCVGLQLCIAARRNLSVHLVNLHDISFTSPAPILNALLDVCCVMLQLFSSTAAALPAEVDSDGKLVQTSRQPFTSPVHHVMMWRKRMAAQRSQRKQKSAGKCAEA